jgi:hypothetical protein
MIKGVTKMEHAKHTKITSETRDTILKLSNAGIKLSEIAEILNVTYSSTAYTVQCYKAAESDDWDTLHHLANKQSTIVKWALEKLGKTLPDAVVSEQGDTQGNTQGQTEPTVSYARMDERFDEIQKALNGIGFLLSEILAELRG